MLVELYISGHLYRQWQFDQANYYEPLCQVTFDEKTELWRRIIDNCKQEVEPVIRSNPHEIYITMPARVQPGDVDPDDYERFIDHIIENKNSSL